jgi:hypothetical protein
MNPIQPTKEVTMAKKSKSGKRGGIFCLEGEKSYEKQSKPKK